VNAQMAPCTFSIFFLVFSVVSSVIEIAKVEAELHRREWPSHCKNNKQFITQVWSMYTCHMCSYVSDFDLRVSSFRSCPTFRSSKDSAYPNNKPILGILPLLRCCLLFRYLGLCIGSFPQMEDWKAEWRNISKQYHVRGLKWLACMWEGLVTACTPYPRVPRAESFNTASSSNSHFMMTCERKTLIRKAM